MLKTFAQAVSEAERFSTKNEKFAALANIHPDHQRLIIETFDPFRIFYIKKWDQPQVFANVDGPIVAFYKLLDSLASRQITGNAAKAAVTATLEQFTQFTASYLERVLRKDLDAGANRNTFEKIYPELDIPSYEVMLALNPDEDDQGFSWKFPYLAEIKYDGMRMNALVKNGEVFYCSRAGKPFEQYNGVFDAELIKLAAQYGEDMVFDGEVMGSDFNSSLRSRAADGDKSKVFFHVFDAIPAILWDKGQQQVQALRKIKKKSDRDVARAKIAANPVYNVKQLDRSMKLEAACKAAGVIKVIKSRYKICHTRQEVLDFYEYALSIKQEGLILKNPDAFYQWERVADWTKWKPFIELDLQIVGFYEGKGRNKGRLGGFMLEGTDDASGKFITARCGGGFSDEQRIKFWMIRNKLIGETVKIEAKEITEIDGVCSAREPVFVEIRDDK